MLKLSTVKLWALDGSPNSRNGSVIDASSSSYLPGGRCGNHTVSRRPNICELESGASLVPRLRMRR
jgi:hypothetical protein